MESLHRLMLKNLLDSFQWPLCWFSDVITRTSDPAPSSRHMRAPSNPAPLKQDKCLPLHCSAPRMPCALPAKTIRPHASVLARHAASSRARAAANAAGSGMASDTCAPVKGCVNARPTAHRHMSGRAACSPAPLPGVVAAPYACAAPAQEAASCVAGGWTSAGEPLYARMGSLGSPSATWASAAEPGSDLLGCQGQGFQALRKAPQAAGPPAHLEPLREPSLHRVRHAVLGRHMRASTQCRTPVPAAPAGRCAAAPPPCWRRSRPHRSHWTLSPDQGPQQALPRPRRHTPRRAAPARQRCRASTADPPPSGTLALPDSRAHAGLARVPSAAPGSGSRPCAGSQTHSAHLRPQARHRNRARRRGLRTGGCAARRRAAAVVRGR